MSSTEKTNAAGGDKLSMKLLVNSKSQRVLYAEAGKDVVDFLFSLLTLPLGTVAKLIADDSPAAGSVVNLYSSVDKLDDTYICRDNAKDALLRPAGGCESGKLLQLPEAKAPQTTLQIFRCIGTYVPNCRSYVTMVSGTTCGSCGARMTTQAQLVGSVGGAGSPAAAAGAAGFVQRIVTYTVMDDLKIAPMSTISGITILNTFGITDIGSLQEKTVQLGYAEGLEMLKASLQSKTVLTDVFLGKKRKASSP
ncbi:unnamed protein product [Triticum turgidum subsp. durum]|uniref:DUF674 domain-containing protein n=1 Tax=Triticum turgidum subsp. durum TaxID=4567 RepID=A0A9R1QB42_TRITD|nr:unnamed protein product [Triticum turgidum subsp. durum]